MADDQGIGDRLTRWATPFAAAAAAFASIAALSRDFAEVTRIFRELSPIEIWAIAGTLSALCIASIVNARRPRSVLLKPEALRLDRGNPAHLFGRSDDVASLCDLVDAERLVFVEGESGSGKSALLRAGVVPRLEHSAGLLPVYVGTLVSDDWDAGARRLTATAFGSALAAFEPDAIAALFPNGIVTPDGLAAALANAHAATGRMPVLLFDQFDDYQSRFHDRFLVRRRTWLKPQALIAANGFWADVAKLLDARRVHCVVVTRTDTAGGLASVRFADSATFRVDRLPTHRVAEIVDALAADGGVSQPERGWTQIVRRLAADLERGDSILPQQLRIVLLGLPTLPRGIMSVAAYERAGGAAGLEAAFIEDCIDRVARLTRLQSGQIRRVLRALIDPETPYKTVERSRDELAAAVPDAPADALDAALTELARLDVLRTRVEAGERTHRWLLDHDYLARATTEAERRANRWTTTLTEGDRDLRIAGSLGARWNALLPPATLLRLGWHRTRRRFRFGAHRRYALLSGLRFAPIAAVLTVALAGGAFLLHQQREQQIRDDVADRLNRLMFDQRYIGSEFDVGASDSRTLVSIAQLGDEAREYALAASIDDPSRHERLLRQPHAVVAAAVGISSQRRERIVARIAAIANAQLQANAYPSSTAQIVAVVANTLERRDRIPIDWWLAAIEANAGDPPAATWMDEMLAPLAADLDPQQAARLLRALLPRITAVDAFGDDVLGLHLAALAARLDAAAVQSALPHFVAALEAARSDPQRIAMLGIAMAPIAASLTPAQAESTAGIFAASVSVSNLPHLESLNRAFSAIVSGLPAAQAGPAATTYLQRLIPLAANQPMLPASAWADLAPVAHRLDSAHAVALAGDLLAAETLHLPEALDETYALLVPQMDAASIEPLVLGVLDAAERRGIFLFPNVDHWSSDTGSGFALLVDRLDPARAAALAPRLRTAIAAATRNLSMAEALGRGLARWLTKIDRAQADAVVDALLHAAPDQRLAASLMLVHLLDRLSDEQRTAVAEDLRDVGALERQLLDASYLPVLALQFDRIGAEALLIQLQDMTMPGMSDVQRRHMLPRVIEAVAGGYAPDQIMPLARRLGREIAAGNVAERYRPEEVAGAFAAVARRLTADDAETLLMQLLSSLRSQELDPLEVQIYTRGLEALAAPLTPAHADRVASRCLAALDDAGRTAQLAIAHGIAPLADRLTPERAQAIADRSIDVIRNGADVAVVEAHARVVVAMSRHGTAEQRALRLERILEHPLLLGDTRRAVAAALHAAVAPDTPFDGRIWPVLERLAAERQAGRYTVAPLPLFAD